MSLEYSHGVEHHLPAALEANVCIQTILGAGFCWRLNRHGYIILRGQMMDGLDGISGISASVEKQVAVKSVPHVCSQLLF